MSVPRDIILKNVLNYVMNYYIFLNEFHLNPHDTILMTHTYQFTVNTTERRSLEYYNMLNNLSTTIIDYIDINS